MLHRKLVELRKKRGITQKDLAKQVGVTRSALSQYEIGTRNPDYDTLRRMADYFGVTTDDLLGRQTYPASNESETEHIIKQIIQKYQINLSNPKDKEKLEQLVKLVFDDNSST